MLGFVLVGLAIINIMIIILLFKACWYNEYLKQAIAAGKPINRCPEGDHAHVVAAQNNLWAAFEKLTHEQWARAYKAANRFGVYKDTASGHILPCASADATECKGALNILATETTFAKFAASKTYYKYAAEPTHEVSGHAVAYTEATCVGISQ